MSTIAQRLKELQIELPTAGAPAAAYVMSAQTGNTLFLSGHIAKKDGKPLVGKLGLTMNTEEGKLAARSIAIDLKAMPLGAPVFLSTTRPLSSQVLQKLVMAQDTGKAIVGGVRADYYWGTGDSAGELAGRMKQDGKMWLLLPR